MKRAILICLFLALSILGADRPKRIVSLSPNMTEMLYGIGAFGQVVAVSDYCTYPPSVTKLPSVGGWHNPSLEKLTALRPDLVVIDDGQAPFVEDKFRDLGLRIIVAPDHTIDNVYSAIMALGRASNHEVEAQKLIASTREGLSRVGRKTAALPKTRVILIVDRTPGTLRDLYTTTEGSFLSELVAIAGGHVAASAAKNGYGKLNKENLLAIDPDVILDFIHGAKSRFAGDPMEAWSEMPELKAVRDHRVYGVNQDFVPHASQRMVETAELFARLIHPEAH
jgi:iron complex transport system substrate-binding protein